jgi:hypothetical protein
MSYLTAFTTVATMLPNLVGFQDVKSPDTQKPSITILDAKPSQTDSFQSITEPSATDIQYAHSDYYGHAIPVFPEGSEEANLAKIIDKAKPVMGEQAGTYKKFGWVTKKEAVRLLRFMEDNYGKGITLEGSNQYRKEPKRQTEKVYDFLEQAKERAKFLYDKHNTGKIDANEWYDLLHKSEYNKPTYIDIPNPLEKVQNAYNKLIQRREENSNQKMLRDVQKGAKVAANQGKTIQQAGHQDIIEVPRLFVPAPDAKPIPTAPKGKARANQPASVPNP